jgi:hypothetical protein
VIHVRVRHHDIAHARALRGAQADGDAPGVDADAPVHDEATQALLRRGATLGVYRAGQEFNLHGVK